jgi:peptide subunit release factor 1 (eRF1)
MRKVEYRCNHCMIVESKWLLKNDSSTEFITCRKCGLESKKIGTEDVSQPSNLVLDELKRT